MIDRAIGIVGIGLAIIFALLQHKFPELPGWAGMSGIGFGILLVGLSVGLLLAGGLRRRRAVNKTASLHLHVYGDHRTPDRISFDNIFRWFYLQASVDQFGPNGKTRVAQFVTLFIAFEDDVAVSTLRVRSPDMRLPDYEVKEFNQRFAIVVFTENVPAGTLQVSVSP